MSYNPMSADDYEAIEWLEETSEEIPALKTAWTLLKNYYEDCCEELMKIDEKDSPFANSNEKESVYRFVGSLISSDAKDREVQEAHERFINEVAKSLRTSKEEIKNILEHSSDNNLEQEWIIAKVARLYNMHLKLGHSARITFVAEHSLEALEKDQEVSNMDVLRRTVLLSALLHDVGRFYQAAHYNNLDDQRMKNSEIPIGDLEVDHAVAGYYYSLASALELHKLGVDANDDEMLRFVTESVAAVVVKCHQQKNSAISYFDYTGSSGALNDANLVGNAYLFVNDSYDRARLMNLDVEHQMNAKHKKFIDDFVRKIKNILSSRKIDYSSAGGFQIDVQQVNDDFQDLHGEIQKVLSSMQGKSSSEVSESIVEIMRRKIKEVANVELNDSEKEQYRSEIEEALRGILDYDIASSIEEGLKEGKRPPASVHYLLSSAMYMTMDADKIDILNQRALGIYNTTYKVNTLETYPTKDSSLKDILNQRFHFHLNSDPFIIDYKVVNVINKMSPEVKKMMYEKLKSVGVENLKEFPKDLKIEVYRDKVVINGQEQIGNEIYNMFHEEWISYVSRNVSEVKGNPDAGFRNFKENNYDLLTIGISRDVLEENMESLSDEDKKKALRELLVSDGMKKRFMLEGDNGIKKGWVLDSENSDEMVHGTISGLLWQLNQFIMVNMRNRSSLLFIKEYNILDQILEQYKQQDPMIADVLEEYISYCKEYVDYCLEAIHANTLTGEDLTQMRKEVYENYHREEGKRY